jgi:hypothetical protein
MLLTAATIILQLACKQLCFNDFVKHKFSGKEQCLL